MRIPGPQMIEVVAEVHLASDETIEVLVESSGGEIVVLRESTSVMIERYDAIERIARDINILRLGVRRKAQRHPEAVMCPVTRLCAHPAAFNLILNLLLTG